MNKNACEFFFYLQRLIVSPIYNMCINKILNQDQEKRALYTRFEKGILEVMSPIQGYAVFVAI